MSNLRRGHHDAEYDISKYSDNYDISNYSPEEEQILNSIRLPAPITPISDAKDTTEDNMDTTNNPAESNTTAVIINTEHSEHNQDISADKHKHATTVVEHFYKNLHSLQYIIAGWIKLLIITTFYHLQLQNLYSWVKTEVI